eukprot:14609951-Alexandrium_andersonii.AAC.1
MYCNARRSGGTSSYDTRNSGSRVGSVVSARSTGWRAHRASSLECELHQGSLHGRGLERSRSHGSLR